MASEVLHKGTQLTPLPTVTTVQGYTVGHWSVGRSLIRLGEKGPASKLNNRSIFVASNKDNLSLQLSTAQSHQACMYPLAVNGRAVGPLENGIWKFTQPKRSRPTGQVHWTSRHIIPTLIELSFKRQPSAGHLEATYVKKLKTCIISDTRGDLKILHEQQNTHWPSAMNLPNRYSLKKVEQFHCLSLNWAWHSMMAERLPEAIASMGFESE